MRIILILSLFGVCEYFLERFGAFLLIIYFLVGVLGTVDCRSVHHRREKKQLVVVRGLNNVDVIRGTPLLLIPVPPKRGGHRKRHPEFQIAPFEDPVKRSQATFDDPELIRTFKNAASFRGRGKGNAKNKGKDKSKNKKKPKTAKKKKQKKPKANSKKVRNKKSQVNIFLPPTIPVGGRPTRPVPRPFGRFGPNVGSRPIFNIDRDVEE
jgi:hypothetical protein